MDPQTTPQPTPSPVPTPPQPEPARPAQATPVSVPTSDQRPVAPWPANQPAPQVAPAPVSTPTPAPITPPAPSEQEVISVGTEVAEAAGAIPTQPAAPAMPTPPTGPGPKSVDGFGTGATQAQPPVSPTPMTPPEPPSTPMDTNEAQALFNEDQNPGKPKKEHPKLKKVLKIVLGLIVVSVVALGAYIFFMGNSAAQSYKNSSSLEEYKNTFAKISESLTAEEVNSESLESALNELSTINTNSPELANVFLGNLNPNYKTANNFDVAYSAFTQKAKDYEVKYASSATYISAIADAQEALGDLNDSVTLDLNTLTAEELTQTITAYSTACSGASTKLNETTVPDGYQEATSDMSSAIKQNCTDTYSAIVTEVLAGKTGVLSEVDKTSLASRLKSALDLNTLALSGSGGENSLDLSQVADFSKSVADEATALQQEVEAILAS